MFFHHEFQLLEMFQLKDISKENKISVKYLLLMHKVLNHFFFITELIETTSDILIAYFPQENINLKNKILSELLKFS